jgi:hypothetical protein
MSDESPVVARDHRASQGRLRPCLAEWRAGRLAVRWFEECLLQTSLSVFGRSNIDELQFVAWVGAAYAVLPCTKSARGGCDPSAPHPLPRISVGTTDASRERGLGRPARCDRRVHAGRRKVGVLTGSPVASATSLPPRTNAIQHGRRRVRLTRGPRSGSVRGSLSVVSNIFTCGHDPLDTLRSQETQETLVLFVTLRY